MVSQFGEVFGMNQYCGPAVLSAITGRSTDECAAVIGSISGARVIKAVDVNHLERAIAKLDFKVTRMPVPARSLYSVVSALVSAGREGMYVIVVPSHFVAIEIKGTEVLFIDNHTKKPMRLEASARLMQQVNIIWKIVAESPEEIKKRRFDEKSKFLNGRIADLDSEITHLITTRDNYQKELDKLIEENK